MNFMHKIHHDEGIKAERTYQHLCQMSTLTILQFQHPKQFLEDSKNSACSITYEEHAMLQTQIQGHQLIETKLPFQESVNLNPATENQPIGGHPLKDSFKLQKMGSSPHPDVLVSVVSLSITPYCPQNFALMWCHKSLLKQNQTNHIHPFGTIERSIW